MTTVARCLAKAGPLSPRVAAMHGLFQEFVVLCRGVIFGGGGGGGDAGLDVGNINSDMGLVSVPFGLGGGGIGNGD